MKKKFILVYPGDDTGNDDGILDREDMTDEQANTRNEANMNSGLDFRWIPLVKEKADHLHNDKYDNY